MLHPQSREVCHCKKPDRTSLFTVRNFLQDTGGKRIIEDTMERLELKNVTSEMKTMQRVNLTAETAEQYRWPWTHSIRKCTPCSWTGANWTSLLLPWSPCQPLPLLWGGEGVLNLETEKCKGLTSSGSFQGAERGPSHFILVILYFLQKCPPKEFTLKKTTETVAQLKGFLSWGALFKNQRWSSGVSLGMHIPNCPCREV